MSLGDNIKKKRLENHLTLEQVAHKVGISRQTMSRYENNIITNIPSDKIELMAVALHTTPAYLMGWGKDDEPQPKAPVQKKPEANVVKIAGRDGSFVERKLSDDQAELIKKMIEQMPPPDDDRL